MRARAVMRWAVAVLAAVAGGGVIVALHARQGESMGFSGADLWEQYDSAGRPAPRRVRLSAAQADRLAGEFAGLGTGRRSDVAGSWLAGWAVVFAKPDGTTLPVNIDRAGQVWSEGAGDWQAGPGLLATLTAAFASGTPAPPASQPSE